MKILHLSTYDSLGGAFIAASRLNDALCKNGIESIMGVLYKSLNKSNITVVEREQKGKYNYLLTMLNDKINAKTKYKQNSCFTNMTFPNHITQWVKKNNPDIIHIHWVSNCFLNVPAFYELANLGKPLIFTCHDSWNFTGGCHIIYECVKYKTQCDNCPSVINKPFFNQIYFEWKKKYKFFQDIRPQIIVPSTLFSEVAKSSTILRGLPIENIPNTFDENIFKPMDKKYARKIFNIPEDKLCIVVGARSYFKGSDLFYNSLKKINKKLPLCCIEFGGKKEDTIPSDIPYYPLGRFFDEVSMALIYSAADIYVSPSRVETFSNTTMESCACGTPIAAFSIGGVPDIIDHKQNGMIAEPYDTDELAAGIEYILENKERRIAMGKEARSIALQKCSQNVVAQKHIDLYHNLLNK